MPETTTPPMVSNPYRAAVGQALASARPVAASCATAFDDVISAMKGNAWTSTTADAFFSALQSNDAAAARAGQDCVDALQRTFDGAPEQVPAGSPDTKWRQLY